MRYVTVVLASVFLAILAAAGATAVDPSKAEAATTVRSCTGEKVRLGTAEKRMLELHNRARAKHDRRRLCVHPRLQRAATAHSRRMIQSDNFTHGNVGRRLKSFRYRWRAYAENIARDSGRPSSKGTFKRWMRSSHHRSNLLNRRLKEVGIGAVPGNFGGRKATAWTVDFGTRR